VSTTWAPFFLASTLATTIAKPILFTTFTANLAQAIESDLRELGGADLLDLVDVVNVDKLASRLTREAEPVAPHVIVDEEISDLWQQISDEVESEYPGPFLANEWEHVILAQGCGSRDEYFRADRAGRGVRLDRRGRTDVWRAAEAFTQRLIEASQQTFLQLADAAARYLDRRTERPYKHLIVDEAQDLHAAQWRMLRAVVDEGPNDIFVVGDSHQRIYDRQSSLFRVGINVRGRSRRLRINYRTTHEILRWSLSILGDVSYDDLDDGADEHTFAGYYSYLHGSIPAAEGFTTKKAELDALVDRLTSWIADGVHAEDIGVCARSSGSFEFIERSCRAAGISVCRLQQDLPTGDGVRLGTMHRLKGLEFRCVAVYDVDDDTVPMPSAVADESEDPVQHAWDLQRERCVLYVACTRAREDLWVGWSGHPSRFLVPVLPS
jgi:ATP-dependent exoDNAse (exonuclease V) beta subunit